MKQSDKEIYFPDKNFLVCGRGAATCTPSAKKTPKNVTRLFTIGQVNGIKLLIYIEKLVVGGTGLEPVTKAL